MAFVSGSQQYDGVHRATFPVYQVSREVLDPVRWFQCIDPSHSEGWYLGGEVVRGLRLPSSVLEMGVNRFYSFPHRLRGLREDRIVLCDPTLIHVSKGTQREKTIVFVHDLRPVTPYGDRPSTRWMFRHALPRLRSVRRIVVWSQFIREALEELVAPSADIYLLPPWVPTTSREGMDEAREAEVRRGERQDLTVLYVATDRPYKNLTFFFDLAGALGNERDPAFRFVLVSALRPETQIELARRHLSNLTVVSSVPDIQTIYRRADVLVFPSLYEGLGLPLVEAMAHGLPVLASDREPMREVVAHGGTLLRTDELRAWTEALRELTSPSIYRAASQRALSRAQEFSHDRLRSAIPGLLA